MTRDEIEQRTQDAKRSMTEVCVRYVLSLPHMNVDTTWGDRITGLVIDMAREVDTILDQIRDVAVEQWEYHR